MPMTPAKKHFHRTQAGLDAARAEASGSYENANANLYELMLMQLASHKRRLKEIQSVENKIEVKREILPEYEAYIAGVLESDAGVQDDVLMTIMVWRIDTGDLWGALAIGEYALHNKLHTPEQYKRDTATLLAEEISDYALRQAQDEKNILDMGLLLHTLDVTQEHDMPDQVRAKMHKALGFTMQQRTDYAESLRHLNRALELDKNSGVKKRIEQVERQNRADK